MSEQTQDQNPNDDLRSALLASVAEVEQRSPGSTGRLSEVAPKEPPASGSPSPSVAGKSEQPEAAAPDATAEKAASGVTGKPPERGPDGKFQAKPKDEAAQAAEKAPGAENAAESGKTGAEVEDLAAPAQWRAEAKAAWGRLPDAERKLLAAEMRKRETDFSKGIEAKTREFQPIKARWDEIESALGQERIAAWNATQGGLGNGLKTLIAYSDWASRDPAGFIAHFSQQSGVDLAALINGQHQQPQPQGQAPQVLPPEIKRTIDELRGELNQLKTGQQSSQVNALKAEFDAFENEKDPATGEDAHPFYRDVRDSGHLLPELQLVRDEHPDWSHRQILTEAYNRTVYKLSDIRARAQSLADQRKTAEAEKASRAAAASNARKFVSGGAPNPPGGAPVGNNTLRDEIAKTFYESVHAGTNRL